MSSIVQHHYGLMVGDIERAAGFYEAAFGGHRLTLPVVLAGTAAEMVMEGPPGTSYEMCLVGVGSTAVELFRFVGDVQPRWAGGVRRRLPHLGLQVDDVEAALERVERAGGRRLFEQVERWGRARVIYAADPDGNVLELLDAPLQTIVDEAIRMFPEAAPHDRGTL